MNSPRSSACDVIAPDLGPEVLTGSTRLKAGTATKLVLNVYHALHGPAWQGNEQPDDRCKPLERQTAQPAAIVRALTGAQERGAQGVERNGLAREKGRCGLGRKTVSNRSGPASIFPAFQG